MILKPGSTKKLASLSALGVGALVVGAKDAKATVIFGTPDAKVGFDAGFGGTFTSPTLGAGSANFQFTKIHSTPGLDSRRKVAFGGHSLQFKAFSTGFKTILKFSAGKTWSTAGGTPEGAGGVASVFGLNKTPFPSLAGQRTFTSQFALFEFTSGVQTLFGWVELSLQDNDRTNPPGPYGPDLTVIEWAYDDSGGHLAAGSLTSPVPEPSTLALAGLAALALGAAGVRRYKVARKAA